MTTISFDRKEPRSPGGGSYLLCSLIKNLEEEDPPRSTWYKFFEGVPLPSSSWSGNMVNRKPPWGGGFFRSASCLFACDRQIMINDRAAPIKVEIYNGAILEQIAPLWISQPNNQNQSNKWVINKTKKVTLGRQDSYHFLTRTSAPSKTFSFEYSAVRIVNRWKIRRKVFFPWIARHQECSLWKVRHLPRHTIKYIPDSAYMRFWSFP